MLSPGHSGGCQLHASPVGANLAGLPGAQSCGGSCRQGPGAQELLRCSGHGCCQRSLLGAPPLPAAPRHGRSWFKHPSTVLRASGCTAVQAQLQARGIMLTRPPLRLCWWPLWVSAMHRTTT